MANSDTAFGRHGSFQLRYGWLTKGVNALNKHPDIFTHDNATVQLGVGKNMVASIRYWLHAAGFASQNRLTDLGKMILGESGFDPYLEDDGTLWLLHFRLAKNRQMATAIYWLFNHFHKPEFSTEEAFNCLHTFVSERSYQASEKTLRMDIQVILRMYAPHKSARTQIEDMLESPLSLLGLITYYEGRYHFNLSRKDNFPLEIMAYALSEQFEDKREVAIRDLMYGEGFALGSLFKFTEEDFIAKLEKMVIKYPEYQLREDAGIFQLHKLKRTDASEYLRKYYG